jgi:predicted PurR-regulated permease PerM
VAARVQLDVDGLELPPRDVRILRHADVHGHGPPVRKSRRLLDAAAAEGHAPESTVRRARDAAAVQAERERLVHFRPRTVLVVIGILLAVAAILKILWISRHVVAWIFIATFLALALNPAVDWLERRFGGRRGLATGIVFVAAIAAIAGIGALFIPTLVNQVNDFANKVPDYLDDITKGRGRLGFLQTKYHLVDKARDALQQGGAKKLFGLSGTAIALTKSVITVVLATVTIAFMTFFMLLEGPAWMERVYGLLPPRSQPRWRSIGRDVYRTVGGYVTGNLVISLIAGTLTAIVLSIMGVPYAIALGLIVAILDLIPLAGATIAAIIVGIVAFLHTIIAGIVVVVFFIVYQQVENHLLQPVVYGRTVQLSPLAVLISVLIGAELAGVLGALAAIPVAGSLQVVLREFLRGRRQEQPAGAPAQ